MRYYVVIISIASALDQDLLARSIIQNGHRQVVARLDICKLNHRLYLWSCCCSGSRGAPILSLNYDIHG